MQDSLGSVQSVLVLGAGSDIAHATLRALVTRRARTIVLAARDTASLAPLVAELRDAGRRAGRDGRRSTRVDTEQQLGTHRRRVHPRRRHRPRHPRVRRARRPGGSRARLRRRRRHRARQLPRPGVGRRAARAAHARPGPRHDRGVVVGGGRAGAAVELRVRLVEGGHGRVLPGTRRQPRGQRREGDDRPPGLRAHEDDQGHGRPRPLSTTADAVADAIVRGLARGSETVWVPSTLRYVMSVLRHVPRPIFRKLPI